SNANLMQFLFGSLTTTSRQDLTIIAILGVAVLVAILGADAANFDAAYGFMAAASALAAVAAFAIGPVPTPHPGHLRIMSRRSSS
ncbi:MAG TPA: metal ABC transporter permease, partial [Solirubrobacteraceae bacterium]